MTHESSSDADEFMGVAEIDSPPANLLVTYTTKVRARLSALCGDQVSKGCTDMTVEIWQRQGLTKKDAELQPCAVAFSYTGSTAIRALFDGHTRIGTDRRGRDADGMWLTKPVLTTGAYAGVTLLAGPQPYVPRAAQNANSDVNRPLHITDREDVAVLLAYAGESAVAIAQGANLFANEQSVDELHAALARPLHPACVSLALGARAVRFIFEDRASALVMARGLRQGNAHTGNLTLYRTGSFLDEIDSAISQGYAKHQLEEHVRHVGGKHDENIQNATVSGDPGSIGIRVPPAALNQLPTGVRDLKWPSSAGEGSSVENPLWYVDRDTYAVCAKVVTPRSADFVTTQIYPALPYPVYIERLLKPADPADETVAELVWSSPRGTDTRPQRALVTLQQLLNGHSGALHRKGVPVNEPRSAIWFQQLLESNPTLPTRTLHRSAGWLDTPEGLRWLMPGTNVPEHVIDPNVLSGVHVSGDAKTHWEQFGDYYNACAAINQIMLVAMHASVLLAAIQHQGCIFGMADESSKGKSVFMRTAAAQYGVRSADYYHQVSSSPPTKTFMERMIHNHNGMCVLLDDVHNVPNKSGQKGHSTNSITREELAYLLSNGERRGRGSADGGIDASKNRVYSYALTSGESKYMTDLERAEQMDGASVRTVNVPLCELSEAFLKKYNGLSGFMDASAHTYGHIGLACVNAIEKHIALKGVRQISLDIGTTRAKLTEMFMQEGAKRDVSARRALFLAPIAYTEMLLGEAFPTRQIWKTDFEETCLVRAAKGPYGNRLHRFDQNHNDDGPNEISSRLLQRILQNPRLIKGLTEEPAERDPLGEYNDHHRCKIKGIRFYPSEVFKLLRGKNTDDGVTRVALLRSGAFVPFERDKLEHPSSGTHWIYPVAGWGWQLYYKPPGVAGREERDPYHSTRERFEGLFEAHMRREGVDTTSAATHAIDDMLALRAVDKPSSQGTIEYQLKARAADIWDALLVPLADRLETKPGCAIDLDVCRAHLHGR